MTERRYTSSEVSRIACVTARQLQWWDEQAILSPEIEAHRRLYSPHQVMGAMLYNEMHERGFHLSDYGRVLRAIDLQGVDLSHAPWRWLLTDGERVVILVDQSEAMAFLEQRRSPVFALIPLEPLSGRLQLLAIALALPERLGPGQALVLNAGESRKVKQA